MNNSNENETRRRQEVVAAALGSVRAEGLQPSQSAVSRLQRYAEGKISAAQLRLETVEEVRARHKRTSG